MPHSRQLTEEMRQCIANCLDCHASCIETAAHCLMMGSMHASPSHQKLLADCAQACMTSADFMLRMSEHHVDYCRLCADLCKACAEDCEQLAGSDKTMLACVAACRRCEETCRHMAMATA
jgi:hypothetical protein